MIEIQIKAIPVAFAATEGSRRTNAVQVITNLFKSMSFIDDEWANTTKGFNVVEAGTLDGTRFRVCEKLGLWVDVSYEKVGDKIQMTLLTRMNNLASRTVDDEVEFNLARYVRRFRNFCEEFHCNFAELKKHGFVKPEIGTYSLSEELISTEIDVELAKLVAKNIA